MLPRHRISRVLPLILVSALVATPSAIAAAPERASSPVQFLDARKQAKEFIGYWHAIKLTDEQAKTWQAALTSIKAPCCAQYTMATCCCPCNLAKATWGLASFLIVQHGLGADRVRDVVSQWLEFTNAEGYAGTACFKGGCNRPFAKDGCGGMDENEIR